MCTEQSGSARRNLRWMIGCADFRQRRYDGKQGAGRGGVTFTQQKRSLDTFGKEGGGAVEIRAPAENRPGAFRLHAVWLSAGMITRLSAKMCSVFFMTIICHACVCPAARGIMLECCNTLKWRQSKQEKKKSRRNGGGKEKKNNNNSEMPTTGGLYNSALASSIRDPDPLFGRQNGLVHRHK